MKEIYLQLRKKARQIVLTLPTPEFQRIFSKEIKISKKNFETHPILIKLKKQIMPLMENNFGHGQLHAGLVCQDAGAIVQIELNSSSKANQTSSNIKNIERNILLVQIVGLFHDIKRKEKCHAEKGAKFAETFLKKGNYSLSLDEIFIICTAIRKHEAFNINNEKGDSTLISDALYDADKFRWGQDNFTHTLWDMLIFSNIPFKKFVKKYPDGIKKLEQIKKTFRTHTGAKYGPDFINLGIKTGKLLLKSIKESSC